MYTSRNIYGRKSALTPSPSLHTTLPAVDHKSVVRRALGLIVEDGGRAVLLPRDPNRIIRWLP